MLSQMSFLCIEIEAEQMCNFNINVEKIHFGAAQWHQLEVVIASCIYDLLNLNEHESGRSQVNGHVVPDFHF